MAFAVDCSHVVGAADLVELECHSQLKQFCISLRKCPPSLSSVSRKHWSSNWTWYSNPSQKSLIVSMWVLMVSRKVSLPPHPISSAVSISLSSDSLDSSESFPFGTSSRISKLSKVVGGSGAEVISWFMLSSDKGTRDRCDQIGKVQFHLTSRKKTGWTGWTDWTKCLQIRKQSTTNCGQVQTHWRGSGWYFSLRERVIAIFFTFFHAALKSFLHAGNSWYQPVSINARSSFQ